MKFVCDHCGGPRSALSAGRCRRCYLEDHRRKSKPRKPKLEHPLECHTTPFQVGMTVRWRRVEGERWTRMYDERDGVGVVVGHRFVPPYDDSGVFISARFLVTVDFSGDRRSMADDWIKVLPLPRNRSVVACSI